MPHFMPMFIFQTDAQTVIFLVVLLTFEDAVTWSNLQTCSKWQNIFDDFNSSYKF